MYRIYLISGEEGFFYLKIGNIVIANKLYVMSHEELENKQYYKLEVDSFDVTASARGIRFSGYIAKNIL